MTEEEMLTESDRVLRRYARNEKTILCLVSRFADIREGIVEMERVAPTGSAEAACDQLIQALTGRHMMQDINDLKAALEARERLKGEMSAHGHGHMLR